MQPAAIVINSSLARDLGRFRRRCREAAAAGGWEPVFLETTLDDRGPGLAGAAVAAGARMVVAAGGDGTVRACAQALARTQVPLAIVPLGTANLAARALGIPSRIGGSLATAFGGHERRIDLAVAGAAGTAGARALGLTPGLTFAAMAGIGLDAEVVAATPRVLKRRAGWLAYAAAGAAHLTGPGELFTVRLDDDEPLARQARCVVVGNAGLLPGGFTLLPQARLDDGLLDVGILAPAGPGGWLRVGHQVLTRSGRGGSQLERHQARRVEIRAENELPREVDGEVITPGRSLTVTLLRRALTVRVPPPGGRPGAHV
jgi:diacylglycerol kinase family enzyme